MNSKKFTEVCIVFFIVGIEVCIFSVKIGICEALLVCVIVGTKVSIFWLVGALEVLIVFDIIGDEVCIFSVKVGIPVVGIIFVIVGMMEIDMKVIGKMINGKDKEYIIIKMVIEKWEII